MTRILLRTASIASATMLLNGCVVASTSSGNGAGGLVLLVPFVFFFVMMSMTLPRRRRRSQLRGAPQRELATLGGTEVSLPMLRAELSVLADDVLRLEPRVTMNEAARDDYEAATHRYRVAQVVLERSADADIDLVRVQRVIDEAGWSMARARAVLDGRTPPEPPPSLQRPGGAGEPAVGVAGERAVYLDSPTTFRSGWFVGGLFGPMMGSWVIDERHDRDDPRDANGFSR